jgi:hypothetical protein
VWLSLLFSSCEKEDFMDTSLDHLPAIEASDLQETDFEDVEISTTSPLIVNDVKSGTWQHFELVAQGLVVERRVFGDSIIRGEFQGLINQKLECSIDYQKDLSKRNPARLKIVTKHGMLSLQKLFDQGQHQVFRIAKGNGKFAGALGRFIVTLNKSPYSGPYGGFAEITLQGRILVSPK